MAGNNSENSPEKTGIISYEAETEARAAEFVADVTDLAQSSGIEVRLVQRPLFARVPRREPSLSTWAVDPQTDGNIAIITRDNILGFNDGSGDSSRARSNRASRFYSGITKRTISDLSMDDGGYVLLADIDDRKVLGVRVIRSLELLRKLKNEEIGEEKSDGSTGIPGLGEVGIDFFERYCQALFPRVDVPQATQELDIERMGKMLERSQNRKKIWSWVVRQASGGTFHGYQAELGARDKRSTGDQQYLETLEEIGLISRIPVFPSTENRVDNNRTPFTKLDDDRWDDLSGLLVGQGTQPADNS